ncbi:MAG: hypothetical protein KC505_01475 [Myxococcales bacterium]|nr:hypothetical protein [Myxococcales bacterium]USN49939.1 MAG: hypothetical protein H6731_06565 [Myxococcales bacterium]
MGSNPSGRANRFSCYIIFHEMLMEITINLIPIALGAGIPLFRKMSESFNLKLYTTKLKDIRLRIGSDKS